LNAQLSLKTATAATETVLPSKKSPNVYPTLALTNVRTTNITLGFLSNFVVIFTCYRSCLVWW